MFEWLELPASLSRFIVQPWSILTYMFMHAGVLHILFNMLWLYWFGALFLNFFSAKHLRGVYILGGICGGILYMAAYNIFPYFQPMTEYSFTRKDMIGTAEEPSEYYDLMSVIIIRRGREPDEKGIFDYLAGLFSSDIKRIEEYSHIEWSEPFQKEVGNMTGFGDEIYRKGIQSGKIEGQILGALMCGKTPEQVAEMFNVSLEKVREIQEKELLVK